MAYQSFGYKQINAQILARSRHELGPLVVVGTVDVVSLPVKVVVGAHIVCVALPLCAVTEWACPSMALKCTLLEYTLGSYT